MEKKLVTSIGGLGNQMFCYAFYKKLCLEYPEISFAMDISDVWDRRFERGAEFLRVFPNINISEASAYEVLQTEHKFTFRYRGKGSRLIRKMVDAVNKQYMKGRKKYCITEEIFEEKERKISGDEWQDIYYFDGFWQNIDDYLPYIDLFRKDFTFAPIEDVKNQETMEKIVNTESVSVHVRRGDYVGEILDILDTNYYTGIIKEIQKEKPDSHFFFFSNDAEYVKREYAWLENKTIVEHNSGLESFRDMQLMSACKINIIANSTFSIWAALLNQSRECKVYYPSHYYQGIEMQDIHLPGYIKVSVNNQKK